MKPTIDSGVILRYRGWRDKYPTLPIHYFVPRSVEIPALEWRDDSDVDGRHTSKWKRETYKVAEWHDEVFRFVARFVADDASDFSILECLGEWTDEGQFPETLPRRNPGRNEHNRFKPAYSIRERCHDYRVAGMARGPAFDRAVREARADLARAEDFGEGWCSAGVVVEAYLLKDETYEHVLGDSSVWGIESDADESYLTETALQQASEAVAEARREMEAECVRSGQQHFGFMGGGHGP